MRKNIKIKNTIKFAGITIIGLLSFSSLSQLIYAQNKEVKNFNSIIDDGNAAEVSSGGTFSSLLTEDGRLFMWGRNDQGQLGDGTEDNKSNPIEITDQFEDEEGDNIDLTNAKISMGYRHSSLLTEDGRMFTWGDNFQGQLGNGQNGEDLFENTPQNITSEFEGANLEGAQIEMGGFHSALLTEDGRIFTWGGSSHIRNETRGFPNVPQNITDRFNGVNLEGGELKVGTQHTSLLTADGRLFMWGGNFYGQYGDGTTNSSDTPVEITDNFDNANLEGAHISLAGNSSSLLTEDGRLFMWGLNQEGHLGNDNNGNEKLPMEITDNFNENLEGAQIYLGWDFSLLLTDEGKIFTWGSNEKGQLGVNENSEEEVGVPNNINYRFMDGENFIDLSNAKISLGDHHGLLTLPDGRLWSWGNNGAGQLGDGENNSQRNKPISITFGKIEDLEVELDNDELSVQIDFKFTATSFSQSKIEYRLTEEDSNNGEWIKRSVLEGENKFTISGLDYSTKYKIELRLINETTAKSKTFETLSTTPYGLIEDLEVELDSLTMIASFEYVPDILSSNKVKYRLIKNGENQDWTDNITVEDGSNEITVENLDYSTKYKFEIRIIEEYESTISEEVETEPEFPNGIVEDLEVELDYLTITAKFNFTPGPIKTNIVKYRLIKNGTTQDWTETEATEGSNEVEVNNLDYSTKYKFEIRVPDGESLISDEFETEPDFPNGNIEDLEVELNSLTITAKFEFTPPSSESSNIVRYRLIKNDEIQEWNETEVTEGSNEIEIKNLDYSTKYKFEIRVPDGESLISDEFETEPQYPNGNIEDLEVEIFNRDYLSMKFSFDFTPAPSRSNIVEYRLNKSNETDEAEWTQIEATEGYNSVLIKNLENEVEYDLEIKTITGESINSGGIITPPKTIMGEPDADSSSNELSLLVLIPIILGLIYLVFPSSKKRFN